MEASIQFCGWRIASAEMGINNGFNNRLSIAKFEIEVSIPGKNRNWD